MDIQDKVIQLCREAKKEQKVNNEEIAERVGTSPNCISYWLTGKHVPTLQFADKLLKALNIKIEIGACDDEGRE